MAAGLRETARVALAGQLPPAYFWDFGTRRRAGVNYLPDRDASDLVVALLRRQGAELPLSGFGSDTALASCGGLFRCMA